MGYLADSTTISVSDIPENDIEEYLNRYIDELLKIYPEEKIILFDVSPAFLYIDKERKFLNAFWDAPLVKWQQNIELGYRFFREKLPKSHVVEFPVGMIGDANHKWGKSSLHYIEEYYAYAYDAVHTITEEKLPPEKEKEKLRLLKEQCEDKVRDKYGDRYAITMRHFHERDNLCHRMTEYEAYMKKLVLNKELLKNFSKFFKKNKIHSCSFYGLNEISKLLSEILQKQKVQTRYFIENIAEKDYHGIPVVKRGETTYPDTELMIIADIFQTDKIKEKLSSREVPYRFIDANEILDNVR